MSSQIGTLLWQLRAAGGWSLGQVARRAGISTAALSRWESGDRLPRLPELEATLNALGATSAQRALALASLEAPRALRRLRAPSENNRLGPPPTAGDLIRAMRLRGGWTQAQIALRVDVGQNTVARWERGERLPSNEQMQALCFALEAQEEELVALTMRRFTEASEEIPLETQAAQERAEQILNSEDLGDLRFLTLERDLWRQVTQDERTLPLLANAYAYHAQYVNNQRRWGEGKALAERALALATGQPAQSEGVLRAVINRALAEAYSGPRPSPERSLNLLKVWLPRATHPDYAAWMLSDMAKCAAMTGEVDQAVRLSEQALQITVGEKYHREIDHSNVLVAVGQPGAALAHLPEVPEEDRDIFVYMSLVRVEACQGVGAWSEAHAWLQRAYAFIETYRLENHRRQADMLANRF